MSAERITSNLIKVTQGAVYSSEDFAFRSEAQACIFQNFGHYTRAFELTQLSKNAEKHSSGSVIISHEDIDGTTILFDFSSAGWISNPRTSHKPC